MGKKLLSVIGILLLIGVAAVGVKTFIDRRNNKEIVLVPKTPAKTTQKTETKPTFDKTKYSTSDPKSIWVVVNKKRSLNPNTYTPNDLVSVGNNQQISKQAADALAALQTGAKQAGLNIQALSGYRSYATQETVYANEVKNYGQAVADSESARPGTSEHQTGWAVDVGGGGCGIEDCFGTTAEGVWLAVHAHEYGFIIRYTAAKQAITGYRAEPWHIRYIGTELAKEMHDKNITTLEEFFNL